MPTLSETVCEFVAAWEKPGGLDQSFRDYFTDKTIWENVGWSRSVGIEEAIAINDLFREKAGMAAIRVENLAVCETGNKVLTERIDHILDKDGNVLASPPLMGIFEFENGKIVAWRDYFDTKSL